MSRLLPVIDSTRSQENGSMCQFDGGIPLGISNLYVQRVGLCDPYRILHISDGGIFRDGRNMTSEGNSQVILASFDISANSSNGTPFS
jgi:hypothetical protein